MNMLIKMSNEMRSRFICPAIKMRSEISYMKSKSNALLFKYSMIHTNSGCHRYGRAIKFHTAVLVVAVNTMLCKGTGILPGVIQG